MDTDFFRSNKRRKVESLGKAPGELFDYDLDNTQEARVYHTYYNEENYHRNYIETPYDLKALKVKDHINWIQITGYDLNIIESIGRQFDIHPLVLEDINERVRTPENSIYHQILLHHHECILLRRKQSQNYSEPFQPAAAQGLRPSPSTSSVQSIWKPLSIVSNTVWVKLGRMELTTSHIL